MNRIPFIAAAFFAANIVAAPYAQADQSKANAADQEFMKKAAQANLAEIEAGKLAASKATTDDVRQFGQKMQEDHSKVLDELQTLAKSKGVTLPGAPDEQHKALAKKLADTSGKDFDRTYATKAGVADHKAAKELFEKGTKSKDREISAFAKKVLPDIEHHLEMAQQMAPKS
jgi:putative membrane protein